MGSTVGTAAAAAAAQVPFKSRPLGERSPCLLVLVTVYSAVQKEPEMFWNLHPPFKKDHTSKPPTLPSVKSSFSHGGETLTCIISVVKAFRLSSTLTQRHTAEPSVLNDWEYHCQTASGLCDWLFDCIALAALLTL